MEQKITNYIQKNQFNKLAKFLLFNTCLSINGTEYRMLEIELYIYNDNHPDIFTHCHDEQKNMLTWYFHQMSNKAHSYKGGTFKGLDITCAVKLDKEENSDESDDSDDSDDETNESESYGGILIRAIMNEETGDVIEGPCNVVNEILKQTECESIKELVIEQLENDLSCETTDLLKLIEKKYPNTDLYSAPRIGLSLKGDNLKEKKKYVNQKYRYVIFKDKIKKEKTKMIKLDL
jgi:hypothetical protein